jgi:RNA polymerase sigma-B factor
LHTPAPPLGDEGLFNRSRSGDGDAREQLVERYLPLAHRLARRYWYGRDSLDDLLQVSGVGLVKAVDRFDPDRGMPFSAYAVPTILGELKRHFRESSWALRVPQRVRARVIKVDRAGDQLRARLGRSPTAREVAEATGETVNDVVEALEATNALEALSLDAVGRNGEDGDQSPVVDRLGADDEGYELVEYEAAIEPVLNALPVRERLILHLRFAEDLTQFEIGELLGISQMHVSRLLRRALTRLQTVARDA